MSKITALYPGSFDPITNGHLDIVKRALNLFDEVIIAIAKSEEKGPMFDLDERVCMVNAAISDLSNVKAVGYDTLTVELAKEYKSKVLIRGLRAVSDFEYELHLGHLNKTLNRSIETIYLMPKLQNAFISSTIVRNLLKHNGKTDHLLPPAVQNFIQNKKPCT